MGLGFSLTKGTLTVLVLPANPGGLIGWRLVEATGMKFGKHIRSVAHVPWADRYVDYKGLKKLLKPLENGNGTPEEEATFLQAMHSEIDKVRIPRCKFLLVLCLAVTTIVQEAEFLASRCTLCSTQIHSSLKRGR